MTWLLSMAVYDPRAQAWVFRTSSMEGATAVLAWRAFVKLHEDTDHESLRYFASAVLVNAWPLTEEEAKLAEDEGW